MVGRALGPAVSLGGSLEWWLTPRSQVPCLIPVAPPAPSTPTLSLLLLGLCAIVTDNEESLYKRATNLDFGVVAK